MPNTPEETLSNELDHHPWCNFFGAPRKGCRQCEGLFARYPDVTMDNLSESTKKYFPDAISRWDPSDNGNQGS